MLILLDIDGVMVQAKPWLPTALLDDGFSDFNSNATAALNNIIADSNADILLTTSHKNRFSISEWEDIFSKRKIRFKSIQKLKSDTLVTGRLEEILHWYSINKTLDKFVIIDDEKALNNLPKYLKNRLVLTKPYIGLTKSHVEDVISILNTPLELA